MSTWLLYWICQADDISMCLSIFIGMSIAYIPFAYLGVAIHNDTCERGKEWPIPTKKIWLLPCILCLLNTFVPSTKTLMLMYSIPAITQNENFKALPNDVATFLRKIINDYTIEPKKKEKHDVE